MRSVDPALLSIHSNYETKVLDRRSMARHKTTRSFGMSPYIQVAVVCQNHVRIVENRNRHLAADMSLFRLTRKKRRWPRSAVSQPSMSD